MTSAYTLHIQGLVKHYPGTLALDHVDFDLRPGEVHALVGENGAGKSTLAKIISGAQQRSGGLMLLDGQPVNFRSPSEANAHGIYIVHQELDLIPTLTGAENIFLGQNRHFRAGVLNWRAQRRAAQEIVERLEMRVPIDLPVRRLSVAEQQLITIAKALSGRDRKIIIMDEPTSALAHSEVEQLFTIIRLLQSQGISFIYISHHLTELFQIADRVTVMRDGRNVLTETITALDKERVARAMVGREVQTQIAAVDTRAGAVVLQTHKLSQANVVHEVDLTVRAGEVVGITGLMGCGSLHLARLLYGMAQPDSGTIALDGRAIRLNSPIVAVQRGVAFVPEDRKSQGIIPRSSIAFNISLPVLKRLSRFGIVRRAQERALVEHQVKSLGVRTSGIDKQVRLLSGGNQQKVVLAKSLVSNPKLLIVIEPTRGVDVGAKAEIHQLLNTLARQGLSLLIFSSDLAELLTACDRLLVMDKGQIRREFARGSTNQTDLTAYIIGGTADASPTPA